jgi:hypothetical protein
MHRLDPDYLPEITGTVDRFLLNPHGDSDGMILTDGSEVHFPPHLSNKVRKAIRPGETIKVRGVRPRSADLIAAVATETSDGKRIVDDGPPKDHEEEKKDRKHAAKAERKPMQAEGVVQRALHGPKGEVRGALLEDGRMIRFPAREAEGLAELLSPGARLAVRGEGLANRACQHQSSGRNRFRGASRRQRRRRDRRAVPPGQACGRRAARPSAHFARRPRP